MKKNLLILHVCCDLFALFKFIVDSERFLCTVQKLFVPAEAKESAFTTCEKPFCQILIDLQPTDAQKNMKNRECFDQNVKKGKKKKNFESFCSFQLATNVVLLVTSKTTE